MKEAKHPDQETIATYAAGKLRRAEIASVTHHLAHCTACRDTLDKLNDVRQTESGSGEMTLRPGWMIALAVIAVVAMVLVSTLPLRGCAL